MIGLRRAAPDRQGNPIPRTTKSQKRRPLQHEIQKLLRPAVLAADEASMFIELFCPASWSRVISHICHRRYFNVRCAADSLRKRDKNSSIILRHDHNPAK
jgi:hypothetical protein